MTDDFYEIQHKCDKMPPEMESLCKIRGSNTTQARIEVRIPGSVCFSTSLYGFEFCPYCGEHLMSK